MKRIITAVCMAWCVISASAITPTEVNESGASGYMARAVAMYTDGNYTGCLDQLSYLTTFSITPGLECEKLYYEAMATLMIGDDEALEMLRDYAVRYPQSERMAEIHAAMGDYYYSQSNYAEALREYSVIAPKSLTRPQRELVTMHRGYCEFAAGDREVARTIFNSLLDDKDCSSRAAYFLGCISMEDGDLVEAEKYFSKVVDDASSYLNAHVYLAQIYNRRNDAGKALAEAYAALKLPCTEADRAEMYRIAGESLYTLGDRESAKNYLEKYMAAVADEPLASACYALGECLMAEGDYTQAAELFRKSCRFDDAMGQNSYYNLGLCNLQLGNDEKALLAFQKASDMTYDVRISEPALYNYISLCVSGQRVPFGTVAGLCEKFLKSYPRSSLCDNVRRTLSSAYMQESDYDNALLHLEKITRHTVKTREALMYALYARGRKLTLSGQYEDAVISLDKALAQAVDNTAENRAVKGDCRLLKAQCEIAEEDYAGAVRDLLAARNELPRPGDNYRLTEYLLAHCYFIEGEYDKAMPLYEAVAKSSGDNKELEADCYARIGDCHHYLREFDSAEKYYDKSVTAYKPSADYALWRKVQIKSARKNSTLMMKEAQRLISEYPASIYAMRAMAMQADAHISAGDNAKALMIYEQIVGSAPETAEARKALLSKALLLDNMGQEPQAVSTYRSVITDYPTSSEARVAVEDLQRIYAERDQLDEFVAFLNSVPSAPKLKVTEIEEAAFKAAESAYLDKQDVERLRSYLAKFPGGVYEVQALYYVCDYAYEHRDNTLARETASRIVSHYPDSEYAEVALQIKAELESDAGEYAEALRSYQQLESKATTPAVLAVARRGVMHTANLTGDYQAGLKATDRLLNASNDAVVSGDEINYYRADAYYGLGYQDKACDIWSGLTKSKTDDFGIMSKVRLGETLLEKGDADSARDIASEVVTEGSANNYWLARAYLLLSDALRSRGEVFDADEYLRLLRENYPATNADDDIPNRIASRLAL